MDKAEALVKYTGISTTALIEAVVASPEARARIAGSEEACRGMLRAQWDVWGEEDARWEAADALTHAHVRVVA